MVRIWLESRREHFHDPYNSGRDDVKELMYPLDYSHQSQRLCARPTKNTRGHAFAQPTSNMLYNYFYDVIIYFLDFDKYYQYKHYHLYYLQFYKFWAWFSFSLSLIYLINKVLISITFIILYINISLNLFFIINYYYLI